MKQMLARAVFNLIKSKSMPIIKAYACKACASLAYVSLKDNRITVSKCACVKAGI